MSYILRSDKVVLKCYGSLSPDLVKTLPPPVAAQDSHPPGLGNAVHTVKPSQPGPATYFWPPGFHSSTFFRICFLLIVITWPMQSCQLIHMTVSHITEELIQHAVVPCNFFAKCSPLASVHKFFIILFFRTLSLRIWFIVQVSPPYVGTGRINVLYSLYLVVIVSAWLFTSEVAPVRRRDTLLDF